MKVLSCCLIAFVLWASAAMAQTPQELRNNCAHAASLDTKLASCNALFQAGGLSPEDQAATFVNRGNALASKGSMEAAIADYTSAITINPYHANAYFNRGNALAQLGRYDLALKDYNGVIFVDPKYPKIHGYRGRVLELMGRLSEAEQSYRKVPKSDPGYSEAQQRADAIWRTLAGPALEAESPKAKPSRPASGRDVALCKDAKDLAACTRVLESNGLSDESRSKILILRGQIHLGKKDPSAAIADFSASIVLNPREDYAYAMRARAYVRVAEREKALTDLNTAIKLDPAQAGAFALRGSLLHLMGHLPEALADLRYALQLDSNLPDAASIRAEISELENAGVTEAQ